MDIHTFSIYIYILCTYYKYCQLAWNLAQEHNAHTNTIFHGTNWIFQPRNKQKSFLVRFNVSEQFFFLAEVTSAILLDLMMEREINSWDQIRTEQDKKKNKINLVLKSWLNVRQNLLRTATATPIFWCTLDTFANLRTKFFFFCVCFLSGVGAKFVYINVTLLICIVFLLVSSVVGVAEGVNWMLLDHRKKVFALVHTFVRGNLNFRYFSGCL